MSATSLAANNGACPAAMTTTVHHAHASCPPSRRRGWYLEGMHARPVLVYQNAESYLTSPLHVHWEQKTPPFRLASWYQWETKEMLVLLGVEKKITCPKQGI